MVSSRDDLHLSPNSDPLVHIQLRTTLEKHRGETIAVRFSPDGQTLLSADGQALYFWGRDTVGNWTYQQTFPIRALFPQFSPDGTLLVFCEAEDRLQVWSREGQQQAILQRAWQGTVESVFSPDGRWLLTGDLSGQIQVWDGKTFQFQAAFLPIASSERDTTNICWSRQFSFAPDGATLVFISPSAYGQIHICTFDTQPLCLHRVKSLPYSVISDVKFSPNGQIVAVSNSDEGTIMVCEAQQFKPVASLSMKGGSGFLAFSPDGHFLASNREDGTVCIWSMQTYQLVTTFAAHPGLWVEQAEAIGGLAWSPRGDVIATKSKP